jgi:hypothetical protein
VNFADIYHLFGKVGRAPHTFWTHEILVIDDLSDLHCTKLLAGLPAETPLPRCVYTAAALLLN